MRAAIQMCAQRSEQLRVQRGARLLVDAALVALGVGRCQSAERREVGRLEAIALNGSPAGEGKADGELLRLGAERFRDRRRYAVGDDARSGAA